MIDSGALLMIEMDALHQCLLHYRKTSRRDIHRPYVAVNVKNLGNKVQGIDLLYTLMMVDSCFR